MCLTCGCRLPHEDHGKAGYLLIDDLERSAKNDDLSLDDAVKNLIETVQVARMKPSTNTVDTFIDLADEPWLVGRGLR